MACFQFWTEAGGGVVGLKAEHGAREALPPADPTPAEVSVEVSNLPDGMLSVNAAPEIRGRACSLERNHHQPEAVGLPLGHVNNSSGPGSVSAGG